jgi:hypothetical protein
MSFISSSPLGPALNIGRSAALAIMGIKVVWNAEQRRRTG